MFTAPEAALAYARAFQLFAELYRSGLTPALLEQVQALPELAAVAPHPYVPDEAAASFHTLFGLNVFPYQSIFLDPAGLLGGPETDRVRVSYRGMGFAADEASEPADHLAYELDALAFLCHAEAEAWEDGRGDMAARAQQLQADFLKEHLLRWLPAFVAAVQRQGDPFYAQLADLTLALAVERRRGLAEQQIAAGRPAGDGAVLVLRPRPGVNGAAADPTAETPAGRVERLLADPQTDLDAIAGFLLTPPYSGLFLSRRDIGQLGRSAEAPHGFGERRQMLRTFLRSAAEFDRFPAAVAALAGVADDTAAALRRLAADNAEAAELVEPWLERLAATRRLLAALAEAQGDARTRS
ncbi:MAG: molecular chaperone TorD family protein [Caldilineales bacterium]|nr:molecular chaperone TorD family protein [Caldilineales bacterium]MDW8319030.1 molecular chaperone TorD family protein [Anaerolineae bacterium]